MLMTHRLILPLPEDYIGSDFLCGPCQPEAYTGRGVPRPTATITLLDDLLSFLLTYRQNTQRTTLPM